MRGILLLGFVWDVVQEEEEQVIPDGVGVQMSLSDTICRQGKILKGVGDI